MNDFDKLRAMYGSAGFAVYAYTPGGLVTLEAHDNGQLFEVHRPTLAECLAVAMPEPPATPKEPSILDM